MSISSLPDDRRDHPRQQAPRRKAADAIKELLCGQSMREIVTYSFISARACDQLSLPADDPRRRQVAILNPLGEEYSVMRTQMVSSMASVLSTNISRKNPAGGSLKSASCLSPIRCR